MSAEGASRIAVNLSGTADGGGKRAQAPIGGEMPCLRLLYLVPGLPVLPLLIH